MRTSTHTACPTNGEVGSGFKGMLHRHGLFLHRTITTILQANVGLRCNQTCTHCHLSAGPHRSEMMSETTMAHVLRLAGHPAIEVIDITGGAPELHPGIASFVRQAVRLGKKVCFRANLTALATDTGGLMNLLAENGVSVFASFPSLNPSQSESLRGTGTFDASVRALQALNRLGYGYSGSPGELNLIINPSGAFLPPAQAGIETRFRKILASRFDIHFDHVYSFANVPLGRFKQWLVKRNGYSEYMERLRSAFNPSAVAGVMCRNLMSVAWDGTVYDCDFNLAAGLSAPKHRVNVSEMHRPPAPGSEIAVSEHCFTCTAGAGFT